MNPKLLILALLMLCTLSTIAQDHDHKEEHGHSLFEIGLSNGIVYNFTENEAAYGLHVHVIKTFSKSKKIGLGVGYEAILDDHKHNAVSLILSYHPIDHFTINLAPGVSWLATKKDSAKPSMHIEGLYEIELGKFHLGPLLGIAFNSEDFHASLGLHLALGF